MNTLEAGQDFEELPESCVIFITRDDALGYDLPICHIQKQVCEKDAAFDDGAYVIYVNSRVQDDTELGRLIARPCTAAMQMRCTVRSCRADARIKGNTGRSGRYVQRDGCVISGRN